MISIIIPVYNVEDYLYVCLNSVLKQTYQDFEIICIDDASTDSSLNILEYFTKKDSRIKIIKNVFNRGLGYCRNCGLKVAKGKYVYFLNADDWIDLHAFELLIKKADEFNLDLLLFNEINFNEKNRDFYKNVSLDSELINKFNNKVFNHFDIGKENLFELSGKICNKLYLKSFLDKNNIRFSDENLAYGDISFFYKVITSAERIFSVDNHLYIHRKDKFSSQMFNKESVFEIFNIYYDVMDLFFENKQLYQYYKHLLLNYIFSGVNEIYNQIDDGLKERFFMEIQSLFINLIKYYDLYEDIVENVDFNILKKFSFKELIERIKKPPKLTIVVPVFNTEDYLIDLLESIINQTIGLENMEVILVDDCSTDKSGEIIDDYSKKYNSIIGIHLLENSGSPSKPRNIGIRNASSDYIIFQDSDDGFTLDACELLYDIMVNENVDLVTGMIATNNVPGKYEISFYPWELVLNQYDEYKNNGAKKLLNSKNLFKLKLDSINENLMVLLDSALNSVIFKKSFLLKNNIKFPEYLNGGEDSIFLFNSYLNANGIVFINKIIYNYDVQRPNSLTRDFSSKTIQNRPEAYRLMYDLAILNNKKDFYIEEILSRKISYWFIQHLFKAPFIDNNILLSIFKSQQILFMECVNYNVNFPDPINSICSDIKDNDFNGAIDKVTNYRRDNLNDES